ncbi:MAG: hypothetical protein O7C59_03000, partial [Rickettsia endosymbiont of Ixodes persulcatus]|nr:hypothetical protein [Rickettsia endosymbiont of Ixodes persulcatus]
MVESRSQRQVWCMRVDVVGRVDGVGFVRRWVWLLMGGGYCLCHVFDGVGWLWIIWGYQNHLFISVVLVVCHGVQLIVIGNGTVLCETDVLVIELIVDVKVAGVTVLIKVMVS